ncbi:glycerol-3-phosphate dehydrogenase/oxidase [Paraliomyxa miuraensis]|uniref:glycerol-3-phosphate dehydrogenase/oxidase n=1 Tax=Paraliomyxa miuraensis TaxID=376150 RepID=UPI0022522E75|nr:FAD-dependent oxidoreductase [Paraliomyxa miuraensis]MCX4244984.1 FAD-dependent oxidoreductase [Paraliomyxa miuraensis]
MTQRQQSLDALDERELDVLVVGGGINGAVSAAALAAHGARVGLVERGDFGGQTSMHSSNLAWGGIKYMETLELGLVRKLCRARNELMRAYPSAVRETRFLLTVARGSRWGRFGHLLLYVGALLYWAIGGFFTRRPRLLTRAAIAREEPTVAIDRAVGGIEYSDARFVDNDASFVLGFIRDAAARGAVVANYAASEGSTWDGERWTTEVRDLSGDGAGDRVLTVRSRVVVNACGPYVEEHDARSGIKTKHRHVLSKGVHLVVPRVTEHERVLAFFADDGRLFFVIPMGERSSIGTTDTRVDSPKAQATDEDRRFILSNINARLRLPRPLTMDDVIAERCGVRPLVVSAVDDGEQDQEWTALSRKHEIEVDRARKHVSIFGGKLTDCVNVGREVVEEVIGLGVELEPAAGGRWYGEPEPQRRGEVVARAMGLGLCEADAEGLWRRLGVRALRVLERIEADPAMARPVIEGGEVLWGEVAQAAEHERVVRLEDFLRRRTRLSQVVPAPELARVLPELAAVLFGDRAQQELRVYDGGCGEAAQDEGASEGLSRRLG